MKNQNWWIWMIVGSLLTLLIIFGYKSCNKPIPKKDKVIVTDSIPIPDTPGYVIPIDTVGTYVKPSKVFYSKAKKSKFDVFVGDTIDLAKKDSGSKFGGLSIYAGALHSDLVLKGGSGLTMLSDSNTTFHLRKSDNSYVSYHSRFLRSYETKPKLLYGKFTNDSIRLDLLDPNGGIYRQVYEWDLGTYSYTFDGKALKKTPLNIAVDTYYPDHADKILYTESNLYLNYNPFNRNVSTRIDYSIMYRRLGLNAYGQLNGTAIPRIDVGIGLKIKLK